MVGYFFYCWVYMPVDPLFGLGKFLLSKSPCSSHEMTDNLLTMAVTSIRIAEETAIFAI